MLLLWVCRLCSSECSSQDSGLLCYLALHGGLVAYGSMFLYTSNAFSVACPFPLLYNSYTFVRLNTAMCRSKPLPGEPLLSTGSRLTMSSPNIEVRIQFLHFSRAGLMIRASEITSLNNKCYKNYNYLLAGSRIGIRSCCDGYLHLECRGEAFAIWL